MSKLIEEIAKQPEMNPELHDGSYELTRECLKSLAALKLEAINVSDLDMLYLMSIITNTIDEKIRSVKKSSLSVIEKDRMTSIIKNVQKKAIEGKYQNYNDNKVIGMFGTGFKTFGRGSFDVSDAKKLISLCIQIINETDEETIINKTEKTLNSLVGMVGAAGSISQMLHCVQPTVFPVLNSAQYGGRKGFEDLGIQLDKPDRVKTYIKNVKVIRDFRNKIFSFKNYRVIDYFFWENKEKDWSDSMVSIATSGDKRYWVIAPGHKAAQWNNFINNSIIALNAKETGNLSQYSNKEEIREVIKNNSNTESNPTHDSLAYYNFASVMKKGDYIYAREGLKTVLGYGIVESDYIYDDSKTYYNHIRKVKWLKIGRWEITDNLAQKAFTDYTDNKKILEQLIKAVNSESNEIPEINLESNNYWWLNAKPKVWSFKEIEVGGTEVFTSHTDQGTERRIYKHFNEAKEGDLVVGYEATPTKAIVALCKVSKEHDGEEIEFEKLMDIKPIPYEKFKEIDDLKNIEFLKNQMGTLFKLTKDEFNTIMEIVDEQNEIKHGNVESYTKQKFLDEVFFDEEKYDEIVSILEYKKNIILQGAPGVGKTFVAKRLAYSIMKKKDDSKIEMVQFHQNYSYEDFIQGYRPNAKGQFDLKNGIFYEFCLKAQRDPDNDYYFIIDEINRGNLSKIFGELMMLIECDKRGENFKISLTYRQEEDEKFYIPENLNLIGTMNTADRSLAMVDYALRRRFSFIDIEPAFSTDGFRKHLKTNGITDDYIDKVIEGMEALNEIIADDNKNLGKGYRIGHSYFCNKPLEDEDVEDWYYRIINFEIKPLIYEYWFDDEGTAEEQYQALL